MPQTIHPLEKWLLNRPTVRRHILAAFLEDDNLSERERTALDLMGTSDAEIAAYREREVAADSFKRNGASKLTLQRFTATGFALMPVEDLDSDKIVPFPERSYAG